MYDRRFRTVKLLTQTDPVCTQQLDWPFIGGKMRDGSVSLPRYDGQQQEQQQVPTESETNTCNVLDRLPMFQYCYQPVGSITKPPDGKTSLSPGGACHMGRAARLPTSNVTITSMSLCRKIYTNHTHIVARCFESTGSIHYRDIEMEREMSAAPDWMVRHMKRQRQRCTSQQCDAIPSASAWKTQDSQTTSLPHGPEVSYGIPFRWSASRLLTADMRSILCSSNSTADGPLHFNSSTASSSSLFQQGRRYHNDTPECDALLNLPAWTVDQFIWSYTDDTFHTLLAASSGLVDGSSIPPSLLQAHEQMMATTAAAASTAAENTPFLPRPNEDDLLWDGPNAPAWVACNQNNRTCYGKISKQRFYAGRDSSGTTATNHHHERAETCVDAFSEQVRNGLVNSTAVGLDICNLNSKTNHMCQILKAAQVTVFCFWRLPAPRTCDPDVSKHYVYQTKV